MNRPIAALASALFLGGAASAEEAAPPQPSPPEQHDAAAQTILDACTEIFAADSIERLGEVAGPIVDRANRQRDEADVAHSRAAEAYFAAFMAFANARGLTNDAILKFVDTLSDYALYDAARAEASQPLLQEEISKNIDAFLGEGTAQALENPHAANFLSRNAVLDAAFAAEREAQFKMIAARRKVVELEVQLNVGKAIWNGISVCLDDQENYLTAAAANAPRTLPAVDEFRMDVRFAATPGKTHEIYPDATSDIPYSPAGCQSFCAGDATCVAWNYIYPSPAGQSALAPAICEILVEAGDIARSESGAFFSGLGPKAVQLGLATAAGAD